MPGKSPEVLKNQWSIGCKFVRRVSWKATRSRISAGEGLGGFIGQILPEARAIVGMSALHTKPDALRRLAAGAETLYRCGS